MTPVTRETWGTIICHFDALIKILHKKKLMILFYMCIKRCKYLYASVPKEQFGWSSSGLFGLHRCVMM